MKRQSWNDKQLERLKAELQKKGNTRSAWEDICDLHDLPAIAAHELAFQVVPPITVVDVDTPDFRFYPEKTAPPASPARVASQRKFTPLKKNA